MDAKIRKTKVVPGQGYAREFKETGFDPEVSTVSGLAEGIDYTNYPRAKTFTFGINVGL